MFKYNEIIIIDPTKDKEKINEVIKTIKNTMEEFSNKKVEIDEIGLRRLAYEVRKNKEGYFVQYSFWGTAQNVLELERKIRITDDILKYMTVRSEEEEDLGEER